MIGPAAAALASSPERVVALLLGLLTLGGIIYAVVKRGRVQGLEEALRISEGSAAGWERERNAAVEQAKRVEKELADEKDRCARQLAAVLDEQRNIRHDLKTELAARDLELGALRKTRDQTAVLQGIQEILTHLAASKDTTTVALAELLGKAEERAAARDAALIETMQQIRAQLEKLGDRITGQVAQAVGDVVQQKVDQINTEGEGGT